MAMSRGNSPCAFAILLHIGYYVVTVVRLFLRFNDRFASGYRKQECGLPIMGTSDSIFVRNVMGLGSLFCRDAAFYTENVRRAQYPRLGPVGWGMCS